MGGAGNFTAIQILEAGRRAEAEGNRDHAQRFYVHLVSQYAASPEAADAHEGLRRLGEYPRVAQATHLVHSTNGARGGAAQPPFAMPAVNLAPGPRTEPRRPTVAVSDQARPHKQAGRKKPIDVDASSDAAPPKVRRYRVGRFVATLFSFMGGAGTIAGVLSLVAGAILPVSRVPSSMVSAVLVSPVVAVAFTLLALALLLLGQMGSAVFRAALSRNDGNHH